MATRKARRTPSPQARKYVANTSAQWMKETCREEYEKEHNNPIDLRRVRSIEYFERELSAADEVETALIRQQRLLARHRRMLEELEDLADGKKVVRRRSTEASVNRERFEGGYDSSGRFYFPPYVSAPDATRSVLVYASTSKFCLGIMEQALQKALGERRDVRVPLRLLCEHLSEFENKTSSSGPLRSSKLTDRQVALVAIIVSVERPQNGDTVAKLIARVRAKVNSARVEIRKSREAELKAQMDGSGASPRGIMLAQFLRPTAEDK